MRNLLASLMLVLSACSTTSTAVGSPEPLFADGFSFSFPCQEHGAHVQTIVGHSVDIIYSIEDDQGNVQQVPEFVLQQVLQQLTVGE